MLKILLTLSMTLLSSVAPIFINAQSVANPQSTKPAATAQEQKSARFAWFAYEGKDAVFKTPPKDGHFQNPVLAGFYPDPSIVRAGDAFYMVHSSFSYFPGVPIFKSTDLINWEPLGHVLTRPEQLDLEKAGVSRGIFAPAIRYHDGVFYVITTVVDKGGNFIVTATDPAGPWSDPVFLPEIDGIDPSMFFDDDGKVYITHNGPPPGEPLYDGHRAIWMWQYDLKNKRVVKDSSRLLVNGGVDLSKQPIWIEAPHLYKINDWYYLFCAEGGTADQHSQVVFRTKNLKDAFIPSSKTTPILTQRDLDPKRKNPIATAGHADMVQTPAGEWWAVFLATRNYDEQYFNTGRDSFLLPVTWRDGWPEILPAGQEIPWQLPIPKGLKPTKKAVTLTGNFAWRDDFSKPQLGFEWNILRTPTELPYVLGEKNGIRLKARNVSLADLEQPAFIGRRQQHLTYSASTQLALPLDNNIKAGIVAFQSEQSHYFLAVQKTAQGHQLLLEKAEQSAPKIIHTLDIPDSLKNIDLKIDGDQGVISFYYQTPKSKKWQPIAQKLDGTILSTQKAGGFVGTYLGLHVRLDKPTAVPAKAGE